MKEECADSRFEQRIDGRVIVARRAIAVAPIQQRRRSAVQLIHSAKQIGDVHVFRLENGSESRVHLFEILEEAPIGSDTAKRGLPRVHVRVHETGNDDAVPGVNNVNVLPGNPAGGLDRRDSIVFDEQIGSGDITQSFIHRDHGCASD